MNLTQTELKEIEKRAVIGRRGIEEEGGGPSGDAWATCAEDVPKLVAEVKRLREVLKLVEWPRVGISECGACRADESEGHKPGCPVGEALK